MKRPRHHKRASQRVVTSFSYDPDKVEILDQASMIATRDNLSFSEWLMSVIEEKVQQEKNLAEASANPLNVTYVTRPIKTLDDILQGLTTLDDFMQREASSDDLARIEGCIFTLHQKAKQKFMERRKREMFNRQ